MKATPQPLLKQFELRDMKAAELVLITVCQKDAFSEKINNLNIIGPQ